MNSAERWNVQLRQVPCTMVTISQLELICFRVASGGAISHLSAKYYAGLFWVYGKTDGESCLSKSNCLLYTSFSYNFILFYIFFTYIFLFYM